MNRDQDPIKSVALAVFLGLAFALLLAACGGGGDERDVQTPRVNCASTPEACK